jgi:hypothetical protein
MMVPGREDCLVNGSNIVDHSPAGPQQDRSPLLLVAKVDKQALFNLAPTITDRRSYASRAHGAATGPLSDCLPREANAMGPKRQVAHEWLDALAGHHLHCDLQQFRWRMANSPSPRRVPGPVNPEREWLPKSAAGNHPHRQCRMYLRSRGGPAWTVVVCLGWAGERGP